jgi:hypothetical protein
MSSEKLSPILLVEVVEDRAPSFGHGYFHVTCEARVEDTDSAGQPMLAGPRSGYPWETPYLADKLVISCQGNNEERLTEEGTVRLYAYHVSYRDVYRVEADLAGAMFKTLSRVDKMLAKQRDEEGDALSYGQYVVRVCKALGIKRMARYANANEQYVSGRRFITFSLADGQRYIDQVVNAWADVERAALRDARRSELECGLVPAVIGE